MASEVFSLLSRQGQGLLCFSLPQVQRFIAAARSTRDLHSGSYILSWLIFNAMQPLLARQDCTLLTPSLKGLEHVQNDPRKLPHPCLPNAFLALVPAAHGDTLRCQCSDSFYAAWGQLERKVHEKLDGAIRKACAGTELAEQWDRHWQRQVDDALHPLSLVLPLDQSLAELSKVLPPAGDAALDEESVIFDYLAWLLHADRRIAFVPQNMQATEAWSAPKCSLLGSVEQMGPAGLEESRSFWTCLQEKLSLDGIRLRKGERLSAVPLVKRFAWATDFVDVPKPRYPDTATVGAVCWLKEQGLIPAMRDTPAWSGQWLHWPKRHSDDSGEESVPSALWEALRKARKLSKPPAYYAVLLGDGDHMGRWMRGEFTPHLSASEARAKVSAALNTFAMTKVRAIVEGHQGVCVYAGGDDVLALLPLSTALHCAQELAQSFEECMRLTGSAQPATFSMGLVAAHYKYDLRLALEEARGAEENAKASGRNLLSLRVCRRSGEHSSCLCPWDMAQEMQNLVDVFTAGASFAFAYHMAGMLHVLADAHSLSLPWDLAKTEAMRAFGRGEQNSRQQVAKALGGGDVKERTAQSSVLGDFMDRYRDALRAKKISDPEALRSVVTLWQTAAFFARGRDQ